jgi:N-acetylglutamate synthase-like GNAT family acetyltransferase
VIQAIGSVLAVGLALVLTASVVMHSIVDPPWWQTAISRHLMAYMASFAAVMDLTAVRILTGSGLDSPWFGWLRTVVFATAPVVAAWRLVIQIQLHRQARRAHNRHEVHRRPGRDGDD